MVNQAPKGGKTVNGVFYAGGQFLPQDTPQYGRYNTPKKSNCTQKVSKVQVEPYKWEPARTGYKTLYLYLQMAGAVWDSESRAFGYSTNEKAMSYFNVSETDMRDYVDRFNSGERWFK